MDVLTLTATPIPRTLYLSLTGAKEISIIQTSPLARQPIETRVVKNEDRLIREAVLQELNRGGQAFYLHNRVHSIERVRQRLAALLPEARIAVGHGRMPTAELAHVVRDFARGAFDLLLCTTIIESGLDIPNVNTILIDRADRFGMADLYQLRGRVGRSSRQAYAYLLLPTHGHVLDGSRRRLAAIVEHAELGAGFRLALRDLEIRGAGNLLGAEQSGHITAVGFDLYCQLLRRTIARLGPKGSAPPEPEAPVVAVDVRLDFIDLSAASADTARAVLLPTDFVEDERLRIGVYRQIASAASLAEIDALRGEFRDRFGPLPPPLQRLLQVAALRVRAAEKRLVIVEESIRNLYQGNGGKGEIGSLKPKEDKSQNSSKDRRNKNCDEQRRGGRYRGPQASRAGIGHHVGSNPHKRDGGKGKLAAHAQHDRYPQGADGINKRHVENAYKVGLEQQRQDQEHHAQRKQNY